MDEKTKKQLMQKIIVARIKEMAPNVRIALGSKGKFLNRDGLLDEINNATATGKKIIDIQTRYLRALKEGII